jgi:hypothetical protein
VQELGRKSPPQGDKGRVSTCEKLRGSCGVQKTSLEVETGQITCAPDARRALGGLSVRPAQLHVAQWQLGLSKDVVISPFAFMVKCAVSWKTVPSLSRTVNVNVLFWFRSFRLKFPQTVKRPVRVG